MAPSETAKRPAAGAGRMESFNPATLEKIGETAITPPDAVQGIVDRAHAAQPQWERLGFKGRGRHVLAARDWLRDRIDPLSELITREMGKPRPEAVNAEILPMLELMTNFAHNAEKILADEAVHSKMLTLQGRSSRIVYEPSGVIGIISPWNFPFVIPMSEVVMGLLVGNTVVLKPAALTCLIAENIKEMFQAARLPEGVFTLIQGPGASTGQALVDSTVDRIVFTGSVEVGKKIMRDAANRLTPVTLELGGKDPMIVCSDAAMTRAANGAVWGAFVNTGQCCASVERVYVMDDIADRFIEKLVEKTRRLRVGNGMDWNVDVGPMIDEKQVKIVEGHVRDAVEKGAEIRCGGKRPSGLKGHFYEPTVLTNVNHGMLCMTEETFGPTLPVMRVKSVDEAVELANDSRYGLTASVWTRDRREGERIARRLRAGTVTLNDCLYTYGICELPWGGLKESGIGRTHSKFGFLDLCHIKHINVSGSALKKDLWWFPYGKSAYDATKGICDAMFASAPGRRVAGLAKAARSAGKTLGGK